MERTFGIDIAELAQAPRRVSWVANTPLDASRHPFRVERVGVRDIEVDDGSSACRVALLQ
jgi:hypothetical protein